MENSAAFYQTFFQHETLFRVDEPVLVGKAEEKKAGLADESATQEQETAIPATEKHGEVKAVKPMAEAVSTAIARPAAPSLPEVPAAPEPPKPAAAPTFPALQHRILVLVDEKSQEELLPADALLLENILKATGHDIGETDILNFSTIAQADARTVLAQKSTNYFISFGVPLIKLKLDLLLPPYMPKKIEGIWFLLAEPLSVIEPDKARKKRLWLALKQMFAVA
ncbi:hypothetical protein [Persicitalea jodogahamensis]|uniref:Uncharacterized protein n=1 Tax=Persicitalea jodogahamensis TaxID=402147 RepID=A0A8J3D403_9BACT|nr:hypothetical protein [Persicitalea jodogahamensis]GHB69744.1 hypothetical protein GCM10007390_24200 [Persicitalea jodogahamensis]